MASETQVEAEIEDSKAPLLEHLIELRNRLIRSVAALLVAFFICFYFAGDIFDFLAAPLAEQLASREGARMIFTDMTEVFFTQVKVAFFAALFFSFPFMANEMWKFIAPGLYKNEKQAFLPFLVMTPVLFFLGGSLVYYILMPVAWQFFLSFETVGGAGVLPIQLEAKVNEYLSLVMKLIFAFGLSFELPLVLTLLARAGMVTADGLADKRKYSIVMAFVAAAILTPPDPLSQISLAVPIILLYEISILSVRYIERKRAKAQAADGADGGPEGDDPDDTPDSGPDVDSGGEETVEETDFNLDR
ncbi:MAG: twin-arginine translocase subunit TatC [Alphaproteobacteria bacterium]